MSDAASRTRRTAYAGALASLGSIPLILVAPTPWLALLGALLLACVVPGAAIMCWIDAGEDAAQAGLTLALSLSLFAICAALMVWAASWQPRALLLLAAGALVSAGLRIRGVGQR